MSDLIDRQAAIDALCSVCGNDCDKTEFVYNVPQWEQVIMCPEHYVLSTLPSAQPKQADDLISRADAMAYPISWEHYDKSHGDTKFVCGVESYREYIEHLPSAQPNWFEAAIPPEDGEVYINENGCAIMGAKTFWETQQNWIPCSERLPEEEGRYFVTFACGEVGTSTWYKDKTLNNGFDAVMHGVTDNLEIIQHGVIAWMPLPEPYKIERGER